MYVDLVSVTAEPNLQSFGRMVGCGADSGSYLGSIIRLLLCFGNVSAFADDREKTVPTYLLGDLGPASRVQSKTDTFSGNKWLMLKGNSMVPVRGKCLDEGRRVVASEIEPVFGVVELKLR